MVRVGGSRGCPIGWCGVRAVVCWCWCACMGMCMDMSTCVVCLFAYARMNMRILFIGIRAGPSAPMAERPHLRTNRSH